MGLIPINLHIQKLNSRFHLRAYTLPANYIIKSLLETRLMNYTKAYQLSLERLMPKQQLNIKGLIIDMKNRFNEIILSFSLFNHKFSLGNRLIDIFPNCFSFHPVNRKSKNNVKNHLCNLNSITLQVLIDLHLVVVISDASIKIRLSLQ